MMTPKLKRNLATKLLALVAAVCALVTGSRAAHAPQTAGDSNTEGTARFAQHRNTALRASGILMGDIATVAEIVSEGGGKVGAK